MIYLKSKPETILTIRPEMIIFDQKNDQKFLRSFSLIQLVFVKRSFDRFFSIFQRSIIWIQILIFDSHLLE